MSGSEIYLAIETGTEPDVRRSADVLTATLAAASVSCVAIEGTAPSQLTAAIAKPLIELVQRRGVAAFVSGDAGLVRVIKADGLHVPWSKDIAKRFASAREELGARYMVGADAGRSRHDAMLLGEAGAEYVAFGIPPHVENRAVAEHRQIELVDWWSTIFEIPCVAFDVASVEHAAALCNAGADFVSVRIPSAMSPRAASDLVAAIAAVASTRESVP